MDWLGYSLTGTITWANDLLELLFSLLLYISFAYRKIIFIALFCDICRLMILKLLDFCFKLK